MTLSSKSSPLPKITIQALQELHNRGVKLGFRQPEEKSPKWKKQKEYSGN